MHVVYYISFFSGLNLTMTPLFMVLENTIKLSKNAFHDYKNMADVK